MRAVVQRVSTARVIVNCSVTGEIADGLMVLLGIGRDDISATATGMAAKIANLRIFEDDQRKMNRSLLDVKGICARRLAVYAFTATHAGNADRALLPQRPLNKQRTCTKNLSEALRRLGVKVATGVFGAMMSVELVNEGPVTILLDSDKTF